MISISVPNVITIGLISLIFLALTKMAMRKVGVGSDWF